MKAISPRLRRDDGEEKGMGRRTACCAVIVFLLTGFSLQAQNVDMEAVAAQDEFIWGIGSFHRGHFNDAIRALERSLGYKPEDMAVREWLGRAYYRTGLNGAALDLWKDVLDADEGDAFLRKEYDDLYTRVSLPAQEPVQERFSLAARLRGKREDYNLFLRPSSLLADERAGFYLVSYATNEVLHFSPNGDMDLKINGGLEGLDHPFDVQAGPEGNLFISEYRGDRITVCDRRGAVLYRFGSSGTGSGELLGPQFMTFDDEGYLYVTDSGNRRVSKYAPDGEFILSFGGRRSDFDGLRQPTGVLAVDEMIFVADALRNRIFLFDRSGNYLDEIGAGLLESPEGLSLLRPGVLLVAQRNTVLAFNYREGVVWNTAPLEEEPVNVLKAEQGVNGNLLISDFNKNQVVMLSNIVDVYAGLHVEVLSINSSEYPRVQVACRVETRQGKPLLGLDERNFILTEEYAPVGPEELLFRSDTSDELNLALVVENGGEERARDYREGVSGLLSAWQEYGGRYRLIKDGAPPVMAVEGGRSPGPALSALNESGGDSAGSLLGSAIRMAADSLVSIRGRKAVVAFASGELDRDAFRQYGLNELAQYMINNRIVFYCLIPELDMEPSEELAYLCRATGGRIFYQYQARGPAALLEDMAARHSGEYVLEYNSRTDGQFGRKLISVQVEALLYNKSGRGESGFFSPPQF